MTTNLPLSAAPRERAIQFPDANHHAANQVPESSEKLKACSLRRASGDSPGFWTGTREGLVSTLIAVASALLFGGAAGAWFSPSDAGWFDQALRVAGGTIAMASLVCLLGSLLAGKNPIFWGMGMPLLVYGAGSFCALISGHAGAMAFFFGAPLFCGLAILAGVMTAYALDRGR